MSAAVPFATFAPAGLRFAQAGALLLLLAGCGEPAPAQNAGPPPRPVQVTTVAFRPSEADRTFVGIIRARRESDLSFRVGGKVVQRLVDVGDRVQAGQVIARMDPEDLRLELQSAEAEFSAARANLAQTTSEDKRYSTLTQRGFASTADQERKGLAKEEAVGRLERAQRALDLARNKLAYADLVSTVDGVVVSTAAEPGQVVSSGQTVARVAPLDEKEAVVALPETALALARASHASVTLWAEPGRAIPAKLRELSPQADATTRTYAARFSLEGADDTVALGMTATVTLRPAGTVQVASLPLSAVFDKGLGPHVFVVDPASKAIAARPVAVVGYTDRAVLVASGLSAGESVVAMGAQTLEAGRVVRTVAAQ